MGWLVFLRKARPSCRFHNPSPWHKVEWECCSFKGCLGLRILTGSLSRNLPCLPLQCLVQASAGGKGLAEDCVHVPVPVPRQRDSWAMLVATKALPGSILHRGNSACLSRWFWDSSFSCTPPRPLVQNILEEGKGSYVHMFTFGGAWGVAGGWRQSQREKGRGEGCNSIDTPLNGVVAGLEPELCISVTQHAYVGLHVRKRVRALHSPEDLYHWPSGTVSVFS